MINIAYQTPTSIRLFDIQPCVSMNTEKDNYMPYIFTTWSNFEAQQHMYKFKLDTRKQPETVYRLRICNKH